ncbi:hypothetical protein [Amycolatopsis sp. NPDC004625]
MPDAAEVGGARRPGQPLVRWVLGAAEAACGRRPGEPPPGL